MVFLFSLFWIIILYLLLIFSIQGTTNNARLMTSLKRTVPRDLSKVFSNIVLISWRYSRNFRHCFFLLYFFIIIQAHVTQIFIGKPLFMWSLNFILFLCDFNDSKKSYWLHGVNDTTKYFYDFVMTSGTF